MSTQTNEKGALAVMERDARAAKAHRMAEYTRDETTLVRVTECEIASREARAAMAELIEAATAFRKGEYHDPETEFSAQYNERRRREGARLDAAIARAVGA